jgi:hypothetical protein
MAYDINKLAGLVCEKIFSRIETKKSKKKNRKKRKAKSIIV